MLNELQRNLTKVEKQIQILQEKVQDIYKVIDPLLELRDKIREQLDELTINANTSSWVWLLQAEPSTEVKYKERDNKLKELGLRTNGSYYQKTNQLVICVSLGKKSSIEEVNKIKQGILTLLPYICEIEGEKHFHIFSDDLSESGILELVCVDDSTWSITKTTYGYISVIYKANSLDDALLKIKQNYSYNF